MKLWMVVYLFGHIVSADVVAPVITDLQQDVNRCVWISKLAEHDFDTNFHDGPALSPDGRVVIRRRDVHAKCEAHTTRPEVEGEQRIIGSR